MLSLLSLSQCSGMGERQFPTSAWGGVGGGQSLPTGPTLSEEKDVQGRGRLTQSHGEGQAAGERSVPWIRKELSV